VRKEALTEMRKIVNVILSAILFVMLFLPAVGVALPSWTNIALGIAALVALILSLL